MFAFFDSFFFIFWRVRCFRVSKVVVGAGFGL